MVGFRTGVWTAKAGEQNTTTHCEENTRIKSFLHQEIFLFCLRQGVEWCVLVFALQVRLEFRQDPPSAPAPQCPECFLWCSEIGLVQSPDQDLVKLFKAQPGARAKLWIFEARWHPNHSDSVCVTCLLWWWGAVVSLYIILHGLLAVVLGVCYLG